MTIEAYQQRLHAQNARFYAPSASTNLNQHLMQDTKGLLNGPGKNNCFLNCAVQVSDFVIILTQLTK
jgi:hypothetical protein